MLIRQGRIWSATIEEAVEVIRAKYGPGQLRIYKALVQPRPGLVWWEYNIEVVETHETPQSNPEGGGQSG